MVPRVVQRVVLAVYVVAVAGGTVAAAAFPPPSAQGLRTANGYQWLCEGASPSSCPSGGVPAQLRRPLHLPLLVGGASCPTASARRVNPSYGIALGSGPAYPVPFRDAMLRYDHGRAAGGWIYVKVLWIVSASYRGPVLIRGHQLDGPEPPRRPSRTASNKQRSTDLDSIHGRRWIADRGTGSVLCDASNGFLGPRPPIPGGRYRGLRAAPID